MTRTHRAVPMVLLVLLLDGMSWGIVGPVLPDLIVKDTVLAEAALGSPQHA